MKKTLLIVIFNLITLTVFSQNKSGYAKSDYSDGNINISDRVLLISELPSLDIFTLENEKTTLLLFVEAKRKHKSKPFAIVYTSTFCSSCIQICQQLKSDNILANYDVFLVLGLKEGETEKSFSVRGFFESKSVQELKKDFNLVITNEEAFNKAFIANNIPFYALFDKEQKLVYAKIPQNDDASKNIKDGLSLIDKGLMTREMVWLDYKEQPATPNSYDAYNFYSIKDSIPGRLIYTTGRKSYINKISLLKKNNELLYDGNETIKYLDNNNIPETVITYKEGAIVKPYKTYYGNGQLKVDNPLNGTYYKYFANGWLEVKATVKNGQFDGTRYEYYQLKSNGIKAKIGYSNGERNGEYETYTASGKIESKTILLNKNGLEKYVIYDGDGKVSVEKYETPEYESEGFLEDGLQLIKKNSKYGYMNTNGNVVIPLVYDYAETFENGVAKVKKDGNYFHINKKGNKVD